MIWFSGESLGSCAQKGGGSGSKKSFESLEHKKGSAKWNSKSNPKGAPKPCVMCWTLKEHGRLRTSHSSWTMEFQWGQEKATNSLDWKWS
jgi:hypothetical protein